jgi:hypothetical protein
LILAASLPKSKQETILFLLYRKTIAEAVPIGETFSAAYGTINDKMAEIRRMSIRMHAE